MLKVTTFSGQPIFAQLAGMINRSTFASLVKENDADRYCKRFKSWEHLVCMLYCIMNNCTSLCEVTHGLAADGDKLNHLGLLIRRPAVH
ncbi:MAG: Transposase domain protein [Mucilaginibacter sp.]|nr:Transposase domain protein [Mucilaginibacter sp.]